MSRVLLAIGFAVASIGVASAGQIQIGTNCGAMTSNCQGLTTSYVSSGVGSVGNYALKNYDGRLFSSATLNGAVMVPYSGYNATTTSPGYYATDTNGVKFAMIADSTVPAGNYWDAGTGTPTGPGTITVPVGLQVSTLYTMLNNLWGGIGANDTDLIFTFGSTASATSNLTVLTLDLFNSSAGTTSSPSGEIRNSVNCVTAGTSSPACTTSWPNGPLLSNGSLAYTETVNGSPVTGGTINFTTANVYTSAYNTVAGGKYGVNSSGNVVLDDQGFDLSSFSNLYLVSLGVQELSGATNVSQTALSAITVVGVSATPEPSTILLMIGGFAAIAYTAKRRRRA